MPEHDRPPSVSETAFCCPHCQAFTTQFWFNALLTEIKRDDRNTPFIPDVDKVRAIAAAQPNKDEEEKFAEWVAWAEEMNLSLPFLASETKSKYSRELHNVFVSKCFNCKKLAVWIYDRMIFPATRTGEAAQTDMPAEVLADFEEARTIMNLSPRGAAALLRLAVQKLCKALGEKGKNIDDDIASLVSKGLAPEIQEALDSVRVIGNEAVHPGQMDLRDDQDTASELLGVLNFITEQMISRPAKLRALYDRLPPEKRAAINQRNAKAAGKNS